LHFFPLPFAVPSNVLPRTTARSFSAAMPLVPQTSVAGRGCENDHAELALIKGEALIARAQWMHRTGRPRMAPGVGARVISHPLIFRCVRNFDSETTRKNNLLYGTLQLWPDTSITSGMGRRQ
jgi:hypothetical protein